MDIRLAALLFALGLPGLLITIPRQLSSLRGLLEKSASAEKPLPPQRVLVTLGIVQNMMLLALAVLLGSALAPRVGLDAPLLDALLHDGMRADAWLADLPMVLILSVAGAVGFVALYYGLVRPRLDPRTVSVSEEQRMALGLSARLLYGGIVEEILTRWGLMSLFAWIGSLLVGEATTSIFWIANLAAGILFALGHLPALSAAGAPITSGTVLATLVLNLWAAILFGWLFWQYGLEAAMLGHMLFHLVWYPIDRYVYARSEGG